MEIFKKIELCEYKDIKFEVELEYYFDDFLKEYYVDVTLGNENLRRIRNAYRKIKGLLTDNEIKEIRNKYDLSQRDFAVSLGLGEVTITRYESKTVQDIAQDKLIRESSNPLKFIEYLKLNKDKFIEINGEKKYKELYSKCIELGNRIDFVINQYNLEDRGNEEFSNNKFKSVLKYIKSKRKILTKTVLAKLLWYIDFLSYKINKKSMTGLVYMSMPYGAYPKQYDKLLSDENIKIEESWLNEHVCYFIKDIDCIQKLNDGEVEIIDFILNKFKDFNSKQLVDYMHKEKAYIETNKFEVIPYFYSSEISFFDEF